MEIKSVKDLESLDPMLIKKLGLKKISHSDLAKLGLQALSGSDIPKLNTRPFSPNELTKLGLKSVYTNQPAEHLINSVNLKTATGAPTKSKPAEESGRSPKPDKQEQSDRRIRKRPYPGWGWPLLWGRPAMRAARKPGPSASQELPEEKPIQNTNITAETSEPAPQPTSVLDLLTNAAEFAQGQKVDESTNNENSNVSHTEANNETNNETHDTEDLAINSTRTSDTDPRDSNGVNFSPEERNRERVFQLESIKKGVHINSKPSLVTALTVFKPKSQY